MDIEILLVNQNDTPALDSGELSDKLAENCFTLTYNEIVIATTNTIYGE